MCVSLFIICTVFVTFISSKFRVTKHTEPLADPYIPSSSQLMWTFAALLLTLVLSFYPYYELWGHFQPQYFSEVHLENLPPSKKLSSTFTFRGCSGSLAGFQVLIKYFLVKVDAQLPNCEKFQKLFQRDLNLYFIPQWRIAVGQSWGSRTCLI